MKNCRSKAVVQVVAPSKLWVLGALLMWSAHTMAQVPGHERWKQLDAELPTPNAYRTASGAPGHEYYQQKADYEIRVSLDESKHRIDGSERIRYTNNSPDNLSYLWVQLDQNMRAPDGWQDIARTGTLSKDKPERTAGQFDDFQGGFRLTKVADKKGKPLPYTVNQTMMRIDLPEPLEPGGSFEFDIDWNYLINNRFEMGGRSGYEPFEDGNALYTIAQFFPRMAVYNDTYGWQNKQFIGSGEFALPFGDYKVSIEVPADHLVAATGTLVNPKKVLSKEEQKRYAEAEQNTDAPVLIRTEFEARLAEIGRSAERKTWVFVAENVRDFAFASSRKFIWDAMAVDIGGKRVMAMSYYPKEGNPLWEQYSTRVVAHTIKTYSKYTIDYPYEKAISVHAANIGMEYPMICFNGGRPEKDGTYSAATKYGMLTVIIHEVGHNFFPMIINSDERQWTWMDEGLNTFVQYLTEKEWDLEYPSVRGPAPNIFNYMKGDPAWLTPIMTNSESILQFGNNAYGKPATALNILRETVMGRELFDFAFKTYCERWAFKHPTPADLFRTLEDASAVDLDWFWRAWFYGIEPVNHALVSVRFQSASGGIDSLVQTTDSADLEYRYISDLRNRAAGMKGLVQRDPRYRDFYNAEPFGNQSVEVFSETGSAPADGTGTDWEYVEVRVDNVGGIMMPWILRFRFEDGTDRIVRIPVEVWLGSEDSVTKLFRFRKRPVSVEWDPFLETADIDVSDHSWPPAKSESAFEEYLRKGKEGRSGENRMKSNAPSR
ncbi:M1 family peptidase [bacterium]|nr:M1 family peptidase [bacterium]